MRNLSIKTPTHGVKRRRRLSRPRYVSRRYPVIVLRAKICFIFFFTPENTCCIYTIHPMLFQTVKPYPGSPGVPGDAFLPRGAVHVVLTLLARLQDQRSGQDVPTRGGRSGKRARTTNLSPQREQRERERALFQVAARSSIPPRGIPARGLRVGPRVFPFSALVSALAIKTINYFFIRLHLQQTVTEC